MTIFVFKDKLYPSHRSIYLQTKLRQCISETMLRMGLEPLESHMLKCTQLLSTLLSRHGVILVGRAGAGKSTVKAVLADVISHPQYESLKIVVCIQYDDPIPVQSTHYRLTCALTS